MKRYTIATIISLAISILGFGQKAPDINVYPPQIHQQICQESTYTRYLDIFNTGDTDLVYSAAFSPETPGWVVLSGPLSGQIQPGDTSRIQFDFNSAGLPLANYLCDFVISSNDPKDTALVVITMLHVQVLNILINPEQDSICLGCSTQLITSVFGCSEAYSFSWASDPPGFASVEKSPVVSPLVTTNYTLTVADGNYSDQKSVVIKVTPSSGIDESSLVSDVSVFPNPCSESCLLRFDSGWQGEGRLKIFNIAGSSDLTIPVTLTSGINELLVDTSTLKPGAYMLSLGKEDNSGHAMMILKKIFVY